MLHHPHRSEGVRCRPLDDHAQTQDLNRSDRAQDLTGIEVDGLDIGAGESYRAGEEVAYQGRRRQVGPAQDRFRGQHRLAVLVDEADQQTCVHVVRQPRLPRCEVKDPGQTPPDFSAVCAYRKREQRFGRPGGLRVQQQLLDPGAPQRGFVGGPYCVIQSLNGCRIEHRRSNVVALAVPVEDLQVNE